MSLLIFFFWGGGSHAQKWIASYLKRGITYTRRKQNHEVQTLKSLKYGFFLKTNGLTLFLKVIWYALSGNQCLRSEKWRLIERICMF